MTMPTGWPSEDTHIPVPTVSTLSKEAVAFLEKARYVGVGQLRDKFSGENFCFSPISCCYDSCFFDVVALSIGRDSTSMLDVFREYCFLRGIDVNGETENDFHVALMITCVRDPDRHWLILNEFCSAFTELLPLLVAIIGGGIGGMALAAALFKATKPNICFRVFEKDRSFSSRAQGYGLTLQQGMKGLVQLGLAEVLQQNDTPSSSHYIFKSDGTLVAFFGPKFHPETEIRLQKGGKSKRNLHTPRQELRRLLFEKLPRWALRWNHKLVECSEDGLIRFHNGIVHKVDVIVGADGIFSSVRHYRQPGSPLNFLGVLVVLGICECTHSLLQSKVIQMIDGSTRMFSMPFTLNPPRIMWQLSFPSQRNVDCSGEALLQHAMRLCGHWHEPIPSMLRATQATDVTGTPVFDRDPYDVPEQVRRMTLMGDAAHPMSPFKGQGANQALLDAVALAECLSERGDLTLFEQQMMERSRSKVLGSRRMVQVLHSSAMGNPKSFQTRGVKVDAVSRARAANIGAWTSDIDRAICDLLSR